MDIVRGFEEGGIFCNVLVLLMDLTYQLLPQYTVPWIITIVNDSTPLCCRLWWTTYIDFLCVGWPRSVHDACFLSSLEVYQKGESRTLVPSRIRTFSEVPVPVVILGDTKTLSWSGCQ